MLSHHAVVSVYRRFVRPNVSYPQTARSLTRTRYHHDRAGRGPDHARGNAADQQAHDGAEAPRAEHQEVNADLGGLEQLLDRVPTLENRERPQLRGQLGHGVVQAGLKVRGRLDPDWAAAAAALGGIGASTPITFIAPPNLVASLAASSRAAWDSAIPS